ncbi:MAG: hypothetical protein IKL52_00760, partial [Candidatus Gastranaerophilales bacterium]|nr:hypothetical protein [Candidatus Gastranaerophilales bacterium]
MNLNFILKGFVEYLKEQNLITEEEIQQTETNVDISIFSYSAEFKRYLTSELKIFEDITSVDFEQLLSMEIEEGQLVFLDNQEMQTLDEGVMQDENLDEYLGDEASLNEAQEEEILTQKANLQEPTEGELSKNLLVELINYLLK